MVRDEKVGGASGTDTALGGSSSGGIRAKKVTVRRPGSGIPGKGMESNNLPSEGRLPWLCFPVNQPLPEGHRLQLWQGEEGHKRSCRRGRERKLLAMAEEE